MNLKKLLNELYDSSIKELNAILELVKDYEMTNDNDFLNWLDKINEFSTRY